MIFAPILLFLGRVDRFGHAAPAICADYSSNHRARYSADWTPDGRVNGRARHSSSGRAERDANNFPRAQIEPDIRS